MKISCSTNMPSNKLLTAISGSLDHMNGLSAGTCLSYLGRSSSVSSHKDQQSILVLGSMAACHQDEAARGPSRLGLRTVVVLFLVPGTNRGRRGTDRSQSHV